LRFGFVLKLQFDVKNWYMHTKQLPINLECHCGFVLKLQFDVKNWYMHTKQLPINLECHCGVGQLSDGVP